MTSSTRRRSGDVLLPNPAPHPRRRAAMPDAGGWSSWLPHGAGAYAPWLAEPASLTARIIAAAPATAAFSVSVLHHGAGRPHADEAPLLGLARSAVACTRDVLLRVDGTPVVYAHSVVPRAWRHHPWTAWDRVGSRALGTVLFVEPGIVAGPLSFRCLDARHPLYRAAAATLGDLPMRLFARRATFWRQGAPLLVTEVFLPAVLDLTHAT